MSSEPAPSVAADPTATVPDVSPPKAVHDLRRASAVSLATTLSSHLLRLVSNLILTRLLFEEAFGLMALVVVFLQGLMLFSDIGLRPAIIQSPRGEEPEFLATAFTIQSVRGVVLAAVAVAGAAPFAAFYEKPELAAIIPVASINAVLTGFSSTKLITLERRVALGRLAVLEVTSQALGLVITATWAVLSPTVWALVFGSAASAAAKTILSHVALPGTRDRFGWNADHGREILAFGRWISLSTALGVLASQSDRLILGKLLTTAHLGIYNIALLAATMPSAALARLSSSVLFPALSRAFEQSKDPSAECRRLRRPILLLGGYLTSGIAGGGTILVRLLYDDRYLAAGEMVSILSIGSWLGVIESSALYALLAAGGSGWMAWSSAAKLLGTVVMMPVGYSFGGVHGALLGFALSDLAKYAVVTMGLRRHGVHVLEQDVRLTVLWSVAAASALLTTVVTEALGEDLPSLVLRAALVGVVVTLIWAPAAQRYRHETRRM